MKFLSRFFLIIVLGSALLANSLPARAQINVIINPPAWGPQVPSGIQYYYIPEINGFYDLYS